MTVTVIQSPYASRSQQGSSKVVLILFVMAILFTSIVTAIFAHKVGYYKGYQDSDEDHLVVSNGEEVTADNVGALRLEVDLLRSQLQTAVQERDISLSNLADLRQTQKELEITKLQLQQLSDVLSKELRQKGGVDLQIVAAKIVPLPEDTYEYRFDIAMLPSNGRTRTLVPKLTLLTRENMVEVPLDPKTYNINGISRIRGRFVMPEGFKPQQAKLELSADGQEVVQLYDWDFSNEVENLPLFLKDVPATDQKPITD